MEPLNVFLVLRIMSAQLQALLIYVRHISILSKETALASLVQMEAIVCTPIRLALVLVLSATI